MNMLPIRSCSQDFTASGRGVGSVPKICVLACVIVLFAWNLSIFRKVRVWGGGGVVLTPMVLCR